MDTPTIPQRRRPDLSALNRARRKQPEDYHALAESRGFQWLGPVAQRTNDKTGWRCARGHEWTARYSAIQDGSGCPLCNRHTDEDYHALAASRGFVWLGPHVHSVAKPTRWRCAQGHEWEAPYGNLSGCLACWHEKMGDSIRHTPEDYHSLAKTRGYVWLGPEVKSITVKTYWRCPSGHTWHSSYESVSRGRQCSKCIRRGPQDYHGLAQRRGFLWVGEIVADTKTPTEWQCSNGHRWKASYNNILKGSGCPHCREYVNGVRVSKQQRALCDMVGGVLNHRVGRYAVDVAIFAGGAKIACEYDSHYWHAKRRDEDTRRVERLIGKGWKVIAIKSRRLLPDPDQLSSAIAALLSGESYAEIVLDDWGTEG